MPIPCKICESERKDEIERMILNGMSNYEIAKELNATGMEITHTSVNRHKNAHMKEHEETIKELASRKNNTKYDRIDVAKINASAILSDMQNKAASMQTYSEMAEKFNLLSYMTMEIVNNQMAITIDLQEKYMNGECKYPYEQIRGLELVQNMLQKLETFSNNTFKHKKELVEKGNVENYVFQKGKMAKMRMKRYVKGAMFKLMYKAKSVKKGYEEYKKIYIPENPYSVDILHIGNSNFNDFDKGIESATNEYESSDYDVYNGIINYETFDNENHAPFIREILNKLIKPYDYKNIWNIIGEYDEKLENECCEDEENV